MKLAIFTVITFALGGRASVGAPPVVSRQRAEIASAAAAPSDSRVGRAKDLWRYVYHEGRWWFWSSSAHWSYFDGSRWIELDLMGQPRRNSRRSFALGERAMPPLRKQPAIGRFGVLMPPTSRAGSFDALAGEGRTFAGDFTRGTAGAPATDVGIVSPVPSPFNPYGPDSAYGAYGTTDPFRGGTHLGGGGNYGYGMGTRASSARPAAPAAGGSLAKPANAGVYGQPAVTGR
jgi:hypothetical protein